MERMLHQHGMTFENQHTNIRRQCSICERRLENKAYFFTDSDDAPEPHQSWLVCAPCKTAVLDELDRSQVRPAIRTRVAVGLVASMRGVEGRAHWWQERYWDELDDASWTRIIIWSFVLLHFWLVVAFVLLMLWQYL